MAITNPKIALLLILALSFRSQAIAARSETTLATLKLWNSIFAAPPSDLTGNFIPRLLGEIPGCSGPNQISLKMAQYRGLLFNPHSRPQDILLLGKNLEATAKALMADKATPCRDRTLETYAAESVALLTGIWEVKGGMDESRDSETGIKALPLTAAWAFTTIAAARKNILRFQTEASPNAENRILGAFRCGENTISINAGQHPLDLAATVIHEFTHYFFDKNSAWNSMGNAAITQGSDPISKDRILAPFFVTVDPVWTFAKPPVNPSQVRQILLLEEALAALHAGYLQREFMRAHFGRPSVITPAAIGDLNFYAETGPLAAFSGRDLFEYSFRPGKDYPFQDIAVLALFYDRLKTQILVRQYDWEGKLHDLMPPPIQSSDFQQLRSDLYNRISRVYFGRNLSDREQEELSPEALEKTFPDWWGKFPYPRIQAIFTAFQNLAYDHRVGSVVQGTGYSDTEDFKAAYVRAPDGQSINLFPAIKIALLGFGGTWSQEKTFLCKNFESAVRFNLLSDYLGVNNKPGTEGVRPGSNCGTEGCRPDDPAARLCIQMGDKL